MLDQVTKQKIKSLNSILSGKIPDPKSRVDQITVALIYKFMDDIDQQSIKMGGVPSFFTGEFEKYNWKNIFNPRLGGEDFVNLYRDGIEKMVSNPNIDQLFRNIFRNANIPYRDPPTLKLFLKGIDDFEYSDSEVLGDAFEYLLSYVSSQSDAGQFRTPRHIIDFIVEIVNPKFDETILDPACGTAGFLISAYKHILKQNTENVEGDKLTTDQKNNLMNNIYGYDISPDMVRFSLVNMYLHNFPNPRIDEYDCLSSEDKWNEYFDVILANPPFFTPEGGIRPHNRFGVKASNAEVLFVDYIIEHLKPNGRAGIIVPEGIIFQTGNAYKDLRKNLIKNCLIGVISLPKGVFQPYSGVKTSILILDKELNQKSNSIFFAKVENDGFSLGAKRTPISKDDLPEVFSQILIFCGGKDCDLQSATKEDVLTNRDISLKGSAYKITELTNSTFEMVSLGNKNLFEVVSGGTPKSNEDSYWNGEVNWISLIDLPASNFVTQIRNSERTITELGLKNSSAKMIPVNSVIVSTRATIGRIGINRIPLSTNQGFKNIVIKDDSRISCEYLAYMMTNLTDQMVDLASGGTFKEISKTNFETLSIPLPSIEVQQQIVDELGGYLKIIDGCRQVIENYKPTIDIDPSWEMISFDNAPIEIIDGDRGKNYPSGTDFSDEGHCLFLNTKNVRPDGFDFSEKMFITQQKDEQLRKGKLKKYDVLLTTRGTVGNTAYFGDEVEYEHLRINSGMLIFRCVSESVDSEYLFYFFQTKNCSDQFKQLMSGSAQPQLPISSLKNALIPIPPIEVQKAVVKRIKMEHEIINGNNRLLQNYNQKIQDRMSKVWGEKIIPKE
ncbi:N-6 DNA methylase [Alphaproteobacteria bacterium]|nr:N-6 DNA methylase [Alphaproteobacteria bacterium]